ncbi:type VII secretion protein EccB [Thermomonospora echinospora]|uniref:Type VII secretion protein EccB n=1 Tax=Thermomonospora echinospora TaxID=1992 RepID=A0A1H6D1V7_9ACTN|nr:type VII secretion protein EccB [Thermomonospora echinospora]SEG79359.1 type VII secretion protein EccB [Thermomonospora echinospora]
MQSRRDLYQAHRLMMQRVGLALLQGEPDTAESPMKRLSIGAFSGAMVALLIAGVFGIWGLLSPGGAKGLDKPGILIIEKETGTKYIYDANSKKMLPVANYASALLALQSGKPERRTVSRKSLAKFERGPMIGIPDAPDSLPDPKQLIKGPWSVCVRNAKGATGVPQNFTTLVAGRSVGGRALGEAEALVVQSGGQPWVIWKGRKMKLGLAADQVPTITGGTLAMEVDDTWLNAVQPARDFAAPTIPGLGRPVDWARGRGRVGQIFRADSGGGGVLWYVLLGDGRLALISDTQAQLLLRNPQTAKAYPGEQVAFQEVDVATASTIKSSTQLYDQELPRTLPRFATWDTTDPLCAVFAAGSSTEASLTIGGTLPPPSGTELGAGAGGGTSVDQVVLPPGGAALVGQAVGNGAVSSLALVSDQGIRYALPSGEIASKLGFDPSKATPVPSSVLHLIREGPALEPRRAVTPLQIRTSAGGQ